MAAKKHTGWWQADKGWHQRWWGGKLLTLGKAPTGWRLFCDGVDVSPENGWRTLKEAKAGAADWASRKLA